MKSYLFLLVLITSTDTFAQRTNVYRYDQSTGTSEKIGYTETEKPVEYAKPVPIIDPSIYGSALAYKRQQANTNIASIQQFANSIAESINDLVELDESLGKKAADKYNYYINLLKEGQHDYADARIYNNVMQSLNEIKALVDVSKREAIQNLKNRK